MGQQAVIRTRAYSEEDNPYRFWVFQLFGWGLFFVLLFSWNFYRNPSWVTVASSLFAFFTGFALTSAYRVFVIRHGWIQWNPIKLVLPIVAVTLLIGVIWSTALTSFFHVMMQLNGQTVQFTWTRTIEQMINSGGIIFLWNILYFALHFIQIGQRSRIEKYKMEAEAKTAQLNMLRSQLNPHFMFNALNNIRALMLEDVPRSREMITHLSDILRYSMTYAKKQEVTIKEELGIVEQFLELCEIQFEDRLQYKIEAGEGTLPLTVPPMTIQLLAENAVKHGIAKLTKGGLVQVRSVLVGDDLLLEVKNHGELNPVRKQTRENNGIGIENIARRLQLLYGTGASFTVAQQEEWVLARIIIKQKK